MTIICGTDLSHASNGAMAVARALAALRGEPEVVVVHVVDSDAEGEVEHLRAALEDVIAAMVRSCGPSWSAGHRRPR